MNTMQERLELSSPLHAASELSAEEKAVVDRLAGRPLADNELFVISTYRVHPPPTGKAREKAAEEIRGAMDTIARKLKDVPAEELERELDDALRKVGPGYRSIRE